LKQGIHPELKLTKFVCGCGNEFEIYTVKGGAKIFRTSRTSFRKIIDG
jgi:ribosomal protein L31